jgi:autotransporter beta-domain protein
MTNNLKTLQKDLRSFAKRHKNFKYTDSALITFLITGMIFSVKNAFSEGKNSNIEK